MRALFLVVLAGFASVTPEAVASASNLLKTDQALYRAVINGQVAEVEEGLQTSSVGLSEISGTAILGTEGFGLGGITLPYALGLCRENCETISTLLIQYWALSRVAPSDVLNRSSGSKEFGPGDMPIQAFLAEFWNWYDEWTRTRQLPSVDHISRMTEHLEQSSRMTKMGAKTNRASMRKTQEVAEFLASESACQARENCRNLANLVSKTSQLLIWDEID